jgi:hypothetical protein
MCSPWGNPDVLPSANISVVSTQFPSGACTPILAETSTAPLVYGEVLVSPSYLQRLKPQVTLSTVVTPHQFHRPSAALPVGSCFSYTLRLC